MLLVHESASLACGSGFTSLDSTRRPRWPHSHNRYHPRHLVASAIRLTLSRANSGTTSWSCGTTNEARWAFRVWRVSTVITLPRPSYVDHLRISLCHFFPLSKDPCLLHSSLAVSVLWTANRTPPSHVGMSTTAGVGGSLLRSHASRLWGASHLCGRALKTCPEP